MKRKDVEYVVLPNDRVDVPNAGIYLNLAEKTLATMRMNGTGPKYSKRGKITYALADLDAWVLSGERISTSQNGSLDSREGRSQKRNKREVSHSRVKR
jgi:hypothetical protein